MEKGVIMYIHHIALDCVHDGNFIVDNPYGVIDYVFLFIKTSSTLFVDNHVHTISSPSAILINSNAPYKYFPTGPTYIDDYLHFAVSDHKLFMNTLKFPINTPVQISSDNDIHKLLCDIMQEHRHGKKYSGHIIELLISLLLIKVAVNWDLIEEKNISLPHYNDLLQVRNEIFSFPKKAWTISELASKAHLSHAYFQVMYKKAFGVTCISDVINSKITHAKVLLISSNISINQVAQELGYNDVYHFIRQFKKCTGLTPGVFRKKMYQ